MSVVYREELPQHTSLGYSPRRIREGDVSSAANQYNNLRSYLFLIEN